MILPAYYYTNDDSTRPQHISFPQPSVFPRGSVAFSPYPPPNPNVPPFPVSYPPQGPPFPAHAPPFIPQQYSSLARPIPQSLLNDPAFSPDPRSNLHFFSMNDREEIYPSSISEYTTTVADDESEVDHANLPPRLRLVNPDIPPQHARSHSAPYRPVIPSSQNTSRSSIARVIPVPPPISTSASHLPELSKDSLHTNEAASAAVYASASVAAQELWNPPPPYSDSETDSSSNPDTPSDSPHSSYSNLSKNTHKPDSTHVPFPRKQSPTQVQPQWNHATSSSMSQTPALQTKDPAALRPSISARNVSAPELHQPPSPVDVPPRPSTVPASASPPESAPTSAPRRRRNSKNPSIAAAPRDLDRIDELDESDPRGFAWHHHGPYEAIAKAASTLHPDPFQIHSQGPKRKPVQPYDSVSVGIAPGQIFPSFSQYQPLSSDAHLDPSIPPLPPAENFAVRSPPTSPLLLPVQRRVPLTGPPPTPEQYNNAHMNAAPATRSAQLSEQQNAQRGHQHSPQSPPTSQRAPQRPTPSAYPPNGDVPQPSPPLPNPYSPAQSTFPNTALSRRQSAPPTSRPISMVQARPELSPTNLGSAPDILLPTQQTSKPSSLLPRHLPKKLVMPAPLQRNAQNQGPQSGQTRVGITAQRHSPHPLPSQNAAPTSQQTRAKEIPISQGPKLLKKRHAASGALQPESSAPSTVAAMFSAHVRFAKEEETKEARKRREKEDATRQKEEAKRQKEEVKKGKERAKGLPRNVPLQSVFSPDYSQGMAPTMQANSTSGRKLSKRR